MASSVLKSIFSTGGEISFGGKVKPATAKKRKAKPDSQSKQQAASRK
ncbi:MAG TPA: hypothetical protein VK154_18975 [Chitinophagales bacterium]|nr:hypothetical protein [Chitinophagales bacterium]